MIIYKITNNINGKVYIGQTIYTLAKRWAGHCSSHSNCRALKAAIDKYGKENFIIEEIGGANSFSELNYQEWFLIHQYNCVAPNGYNLKEGGGNGRYSEESKAKKRLFRHTEEEVARIIERSKKQVVRDDGVIFKSLNAAAKAIGCGTGDITMSCQGKRHCALGRSFAYLGDSYEDSHKEARNRLSNAKAKPAKRPIIRNDGRIFESLYAAGKATGSSVSHICRVLKGSRKTCGGYSYTYLEDNNG